MINLKYIEKQSPPQSFLQYSSSRGASFEDLSKNHLEIKQELRCSLVEEQGHICCYCGCRIKTTDAIVEHLNPRQKYPKLQLEYFNLLASCDGGQSKRSIGKEYPSCCDDHKSNDLIKVHPLLADCESRFIFDEDGDIICAPDDDEAKQAIEILNLKSPALRHRRKAAIAGYSYYPKGHDWKTEVENLMRKIDEQYIEFCFVIKSYVLNFKM